MLNPLVIRPPQPVTPANPRLILTPNYKNKLQQIKDGTADSDLYAQFLEDSTGHGVGGSLAATTPEVSSWIAKMAMIFEARGYPCVNALVKPRDSNSDWNEDRFTIGGTPFTSSPTSGFEFFTGGYGGAYMNTTTTDTMVVDPGIKWDTVDIYYIKDGGGTMRATATGGSPVDQVTSGHGIGYYTATAADVEAYNTLTISRVSGNCFWVGFVFRRSDIKQVLLINGGFPGARIGDFDADSNGWERLAMLTAMDADLTILGCGINEALADDSTATYQSALEDILGVVDGLSGESLVKSCIPSTVSGDLTQEIAYRDSAKAYCAANGIAFADPLGDIWNDTASEADMASGDPYHARNTGYERLAAYMANALLP